MTLTYQISVELDNSLHDRGGFRVVYSGRELKEGGLVDWTNQLLSLRTCFPQKHHRKPRHSRIGFASERRPGFNNMTCDSGYSNHAKYSRLKTQAHVGISVIYKHGYR